VIYSCYGIRSCSRTRLYFTFPFGKSAVMGNIYRPPTKPEIQPFVSTVLSVIQIFYLLRPSLADAKPPRCNPFYSCQETSFSNTSVDGFACARSNPHLAMLASRLGLFMNVEVIDPCLSCGRLFATRDDGI